MRISEYEKTVAIGASSNVRLTSLCSCLRKSGVCAGYDELEWGYCKVKNGHSINIKFLSIYLRWCLIYRIWNTVSVKVF